MADSYRPLFVRHPGLRERVPFRPIATLPTPVEHVPSLGLWVKRDDLSHPELGGAKIRKLEFYDPRGPVLAFGPRGSNWLLALQRFARDVRIFTFPQHYNASAAENARLLRPTRHYPDEVLFGLGILPHLPRILSGTVEIAPMGGSDPVTTLGSVNAALELAEQVRRGECPEPDAIFVALGSGSTAAGLALGLALAGLRTRLFAVRVTVPAIANLSRVMDLAVSCAWLLDLKDVPGMSVEVVADCFGGYAKPIPAGREAMRRFAEAGIRLDASYTAKTAAAALARRASFRAPMLWNTYGRPCLNDR